MVQDGQVSIISCGVFLSNRGLSTIYKVEFPKRQERDDVMHNFLILFALVLAASAQDAKAADDKVPTCASADHACLMRQIEALTPAIEEQQWQDMTYRELAKSYTYEGQPEKAIGLIDKIRNP